MIIEGSTLKQAGDFKLLKSLAHSSYCNVYLAEHIKTKQKYALKAIKNPNNKFRIQNEINLYKELNGFEKILKLQKVFYDEKKLFFVYDLAYDGNLSYFIKKHGLLDEKQIIEILKDILLTLKQAHGNNIIHMDIKPDNIMLHKNSYYLIDWQLSRKAKKVQITDIEPDYNYTAPEIYNGYATASSDIYSLGATLYYLATKKEVYDINNKDSIAYILLGHSQLNVDLSLVKSKKLQYLIYRMMHKNHEKRACINEIENILSLKIMPVIKIEEYLDYSIQKQRQSKEIYEQLAKNNIAFAHNELGVLHSNNNEKKSFQHYELAAKNGLVKGYYNLGICYKKGFGIEPDLKKSFYFFKQAAVHNHAQAIYVTAWFYENGIAIQQDNDKAYELYSMAAFYGNKKAYKKLNNTEFFKQK